MLISEGNQRINFCSHRLDTFLRPCRSVDVVPLLRQKPSELETNSRVGSGDENDFAHYDGDFWKRTEVVLLRIAGEGEGSGSELQVISDKTLASYRKLAEYAVDPWLNYTPFHLGAPTSRLSRRCERSSESTPAAEYARRVTRLIETR